MIGELFFLHLQKAKDALIEMRYRDGLKGYVTNTELPDEDVIKNYRHLWQIEKAFRISKTDLRIRPSIIIERNVLRRIFAFHSLPMRFPITRCRRI